MALEDKNFIEKQIELASKSLGKVFDLDNLEQLLAKENEKTRIQFDKNMDENSEV